MSHPEDDAAAKQKAAQAERTRERNRRWRREHLEYSRDAARRWKEANPERVREMNRRWREANLERSREQRRVSARRATARKRRQAEVRRKGRARAKEWREEHRERVREYQRRWVEANREKVREYYNRYYATHRDEVNARAAARRDADPERTKRAAKEWAERNKDRRADLQRSRRSDPDVYQAELAANAAARRLTRRLARAGLPPRRLHPASAAERRANERDAEAYFTAPLLSEHLRQFTVFAETLTEYMLEQGTQMREFAEVYAATRARMGLPPADVERVMYARAVEVVVEQVRRSDLVTSRDVAAAVRSTKAVVEREDRREQYEHLVKALVERIEGDAQRLSEEATFEKRARQHHGRPVGSLDSLIIQLAIQELLPQLPTNRMTVEDVRRAGRAARIRIVPLSTSPYDALQAAARAGLGIWI